MGRWGGAKAQREALSEPLSAGVSGSENMAAASVRRLEEMRAGKGGARTGGSSPRASTVPPRRFPTCTRRKGSERMGGDGVACLRGKAHLHYVSRTVHQPHADQALCLELLLAQRNGLDNLFVCTPEQTVSIAKHGGDEPHDKSDADCRSSREDPRSFRRRVRARVSTNDTGIVVLAVHALSTFAGLRPATSRRVKASGAQCAVLTLAR